MGQFLQDGENDCFVREKKGHETAIFPVLQKLSHMLYGDTAVLNVKVQSSRKLSSFKISIKTALKGSQFHYMITSLWDGIRLIKDLTHLA